MHFQRKELQRKTAKTQFELRLHGPDPGLCVPFGMGFLSGQLVSALKAIISWMGCVDHRKTKRMHIACKSHVLRCHWVEWCADLKRKKVDMKQQCAIGSCHHSIRRTTEGSGTNFMESSTGIVVDVIVDRQEIFFSTWMLLDWSTRINFSPGIPNRQQLPPTNGSIYSLCLIFVGNSIVSNCCVEVFRRAQTVAMTFFDHAMC